MAVHQLPRGEKCNQITGEKENYQNMPAGFEFSYHISSSDWQEEDQQPEKPSIQFVRAFDSQSLNLNYKKKEMKDLPYMHRCFTT